MARAAAQEKYVSFPLERLRGILPDLQEADIILVHTNFSLMRYLIRKFTKSYWDHVAMVLFTKDSTRGQYYAQIIEASYPSGIEIHKLERYLKDPRRYDVGIKRVPHLNPKTRKRIVSFMLKNVDAPYYKASRLSFLLAAFSQRFSTWLLGRQRFCSSSFVQKAYYDAVEWNQKEKMIFKKGYYSPMEFEDTTTPADIATSDNSIWIYNPH